MVANILSAARIALPVILGGLALASASPVSLAQTIASESPTALTEVIVTATRRQEEQSKVPIDMSVVTEDQIDKQGFRTFDDIARTTPGVQSDPATGYIIIRGLDATSIGAGAVGIYIDDTPIQVRTFGTDTTNAVQRLFDIDRVEILRGPQGTLFGAGSESGTVRYITPQPSLNDFKAYARAEVSGTQDGSMGGEFGFAVGAPLITDELGLRVSAWHGHVAGYVDQVSPSTPDHALLDANSNWTDTNIVRAALTYKPLNDLTITPTVLYQSTYQNGSSSFIVGLSDPNDGVYRNNSPTTQYNWDQYFLPSLHIEYTPGLADIIYTGSYFDRGQYANNDYTNFLSDIWGLSTPTGPNFGPLPGYFAHTDAVNTQRNLTQELRFQSPDKTGRVSWVAGIFYSHLSQNNRELTHDPLYYQFFSEVLGMPNLGPLLAPDFNYVGYDTATDVQEALFAQLDFHLTDKVTLTLGERLSHFDLSFDVLQNGPYAGGLIQNNGSTKEDASTPKLGLSYQATDRNLFYANVSKGFRPGGLADPFPYSECATDLNAMGIKSFPGSYQSDSVWSYELGTKDSFADGRVKVAASIYRINWNNIQSAINLPSCGFALDTNLGKARSDGFDFQADFLVAPGLALGATVGRTDPKYTQTVYGGLRPDGTRGIIAANGDTLGAPPWTATATIDWNMKFHEHDLYVRSDYSYIERNKDLLPTQDPLTTSYDVASYGVPTSRYVTARAGILLGHFDVSVFCNNLTNESVLLSKFHSNIGSPMFQGSVYPPRTGGLTFVFRY